MKPNVSKFERMVKGALGIGVIGAAFYFKNGWAALSLVPVVSR